MVGLIGGDEYGTIWFDTLGKDGKIFWLNYELEGSEMIRTILLRGILDIKIHLMLEVMLILLTPQTIFHYQVQMIYQIHLKILMPLFEPATSTPTEKPSVTVSPTKKPTPTKAPTSTPKVVKKKFLSRRKLKQRFVC